MSSAKDAVQRFSGAVKQIGTALIQDLAVTTAKIAALAVTTAKIADSAITRTKLGTQSLTAVYSTTERNIGFGVTDFVPLSGGPPVAAEAGSEVVAVRPGTMKRVVIRFRTNNLDGITSVDININGVLTDLFVSVLAGFTGLGVVTEDVPIAKDDLISVRMNAAASGAGAADISVSLEVAYDNA